MSTRLRYFVRLDAQGQIVPGSLIARRKGQGNPGTGSNKVNGSWLEIHNPTCCATNVTPTGTPSGSTDVTVVGSCSSTQLFTYTAASDSLSDTVSQLTTNFPGVATWSTSSGKITATNPICSGFTFTVVYA